MYDTGSYRNLYQKSVLMAYRFRAKHTHSNTSHGLPTEKKNNDFAPFGGETIYRIEFVSQQHTRILCALQILLDHDDDNDGDMVMAMFLCSMNSTFKKTSGKVCNRRIQCQLNSPYR